VGQEQVGSGAGEGQGERVEKSKKRRKVQRRSQLLSKVLKTCSGKLWQVQQSIGNL